MKNKILLSLWFLSVSLSIIAQNTFSYKRQLSYKQCENCGCKKSRSYKILSTNLTSIQRNCAQEDINATLMVKEMFQNGTSGGGLFAGFNPPQEGCGDDCYHEFESTYDEVEIVKLDDCLTESQKQNIRDQKQKEELEKNNKIKQLLESGKYYYDKEELRNAMYYFNQVLSIDKNNYEAYNKKSEIENFFYNRAAGYQYRKMFETNYKSFVEKLKIALEDEISKTERGQAKVTIDILFDTSGVNKSTISKTNIPDLDSRISSIVNTWLSSKPSKKGYYVKAYDKITIELSWNSGKPIYTCTSKGNFVKNSIGSKDDHIKFIKSLEYPYGKFYFTSKAKRLTMDGVENNATEILFTNYKFSGGPMNALYSLIFPGFGKFKVTSGLKGKNTMLYSGILILFEGIFKIYEIQSTNEYYNTTNPTTAEDSFKSANITRQAGLLTLISIVGIGGYDFSKSVIIGLQNISKAKKTKTLISSKQKYQVQNTQF